MNEQVFNKIVIVSLCDGFSQDLGKMLSQNLHMMFCDAKELVEYELIDKDRLKEISTKEYLDKCEKRAFKHIASFENVVVSIDYDSLIHNFDIFKKHSLIVFVKLGKEFVSKNAQVANVICFQEHTNTLKQLCTICVEVRKTDINFVCDKVLDAIGRII